MAKTSFSEFWEELQAEAKAEGPEAVAQLEQLAHRYKLGAQIIALRVENGLTQKRLSELTGIDQGEISRIERGGVNATEDTLARVGHALGVELSYVRPKELVAV